jgi:hypothetical protein
MSGSSASSTRTDRRTSAGALATNAKGMGSGSMSVPAASSDVRAEYSDSPMALSSCSRSV